jgi:hypothetical protein
LLQDASNLPIDRRRIERFFRTRDASREAFERPLDPLRELVVHRPVFAASLGGAAQDHDLVGLALARQLDFDAFFDRAPAVSISKLGGELLQLRLRRADDVAPAGFSQPRQILGAGHAAVGDPYAPQSAVSRLHGGHDGVQGPGVVGGASEHLIADTSEDVRLFQLQMAKDQVGAPTLNAAVAALRFFFKVTLERPDLVRHLTTVHKPRKAPSC